jgi:O-antigen/teichoic acid export membrane protein
MTRQEMAQPNIIRQSVVYSLAVLVPNVVGFLLLPVYTRYLTPAQYGTLAIIDMLGLYFSILVGSGLSSALLRYYGESDSDEWRTSIFSSILVTTSAVAAGLILLGAMLSPLIASIALGDASGYLLICASFASRGLEAVNGIFGTLLRLQKRVQVMLLVSMLRLALAVPLTLYLIVGRGMGIEAILITNVLSASLGLTVYVMTVRAGTFARPRTNLIWKATTFSLPYVPLGFIESFISNIGILSFNLVRSTEGAGLFAIGSKLASVISIGATPIGGLWTPFIYQAARDGDGRKQIARGSTLIFYAFVAAATALGVLAPEIVAIMAAKEYAAVAGMLYPLAFGNAVYILRVTVRAGIALADRTAILPRIPAGVGAVGIGAGYLAARYFDATAVAWVVGGVLIAITLLTDLLGRRFWAVRLEVWLLLAISASSLGVYAICTLLPLHFLVKIGILIAWAALLHAFGIPTAGERKLAIQQILDALGRKR